MWWGERLPQAGGPNRSFDSLRRMLVWALLASIGLGTAIWSPTPGIHLVQSLPVLCGGNPQTSPCISGVACPLCWRCTGIYLLLWCGLLVQWAWRSRSTALLLPPALLAMALSAALMATDVFLIQRLCPNNLSRFATGAVMGLTASVVAYRSLVILTAKEQEQC